MILLLLEIIPIILGRFQLTLEVCNFPVVLRSIGELSLDFLYLLLELTDVSPHSVKLRVTLWEYFSA